MVSRILVGLSALIALLMGFAPGTVPMDSFLLVIIGIAYAAMNIDPEDATSFLVVAIAVGLASGDHVMLGQAMDDHMVQHHGVLTHIPVIGQQLNAALGGISVTLYAAVATITAMRIFNRTVKG